MMVRRGPRDGSVECRWGLEFRSSASPEDVAARLLGPEGARAPDEFECFQANLLEAHGVGAARLRRWFFGGDLAGSLAEMRGAVRAELRHILGSAAGEVAPFVVAVGADTARGPDDCGDSLRWGCRAGDAPTAFCGRRTGWVAHCLFVGSCRLALKLRAFQPWGAQRRR